MANKKFLDNNGLLYFWQKIVNAFVKKDGNKVLSDNNYTTAEKEKLAGLNNYTLPKATTSTLGGVKVGAGLEVGEDGTLNATGGGTADSVDWSNVQNKPSTVAGYGITDAKIEAKKITIGSNSVTVPINNNELENGAGYQTSSDVQKAISAATEGLATEEYVNSKTTTVLKYKGTVENREALPSNAEVGDTYNLKDTGGNVAWDGTKWDDLGETVDLSGYVQESELIAITNGEIDSIVAQ